MEWPDVMGSICDIKYYILDLLCFSMIVKTDVIYWMNMRKTKWGYIAKIINIIDSKSNKANGKKIDNYIKVVYIRVLLKF